MRSKTKLSVIILSALFMTWLLAGPVSAIAGGVPDQDVEKAKISRLSFKLYGGFSRIAAGDLNDGSDGFFEFLEVYDAMGIGTAEGGYAPVHGGYNFGGDVIFQLSPAFGIGLGFGYMRSSEDSEMTFTDGIDTLTLSGRPVISAMPVRLGVFLTFPLSGKINLTADAGATYFHGLKFDAMQRLEFTPTDWTEMSVSASRSSLSANLGFQGSLGVEYKLSEDLGFFVEAVGRYAKFKNFDLVTGLNESSDGTPETTEGKLYIATYTLIDWGYSAFTIEETPPVDDPPNVIYREPKIDLSGFSIQAGIRIRF
jgi:opacity protein-like surface antigen